MFAMREMKKQNKNIATFSEKQPSQDRAGGKRQADYSPGSVQFLQRYFGNSCMESMAGRQQTVGRATSMPTIQRKKSKVQSKLTIGPTNDVYEQEADRVAEQVMRMPDSSVHTEGDQPNKRIKIQRVSASDSGVPNSDLDIHLDQSGGRPLSSLTRAFMEPRFGAYFGHVQVHTDQDAHQTASQIQARAFTYGHHIWLGRGEREQNRNLMAHELTHVVQQKAALSTDQASFADVKKITAGPQVQLARLPCTSRTMIDVYAVNLPGSTRTIYNDIANANSVLCQCGIKVNVTGGESWQTNLLDLDPPLGVLNAPAGTVRALTREENAMLAYKPGGNVIHAYYVPSFSGPKVAESFWPSQHNETAFAVSNNPNADSFPHELGHLLLDSGSHHRNRDNLMASGSVRNVGVDDLEQSQCNRMP
jgi:Zn-dependent peptidase ImmA (M78 family)